MPKCDACKKDVAFVGAYGAGDLCEECEESWYEYDGSVFDWCLARHAELQAKQLAAEQEARFNREHREMVEKAKSAGFVRFDLGGSRAEPSPTDAELIALAAASNAESLSLWADNLIAAFYQGRPPNDSSAFLLSTSTEAICVALKSRGVIK